MTSTIPSSSGMWEHCLLDNEMSGYVTNILELCDNSKNYSTKATIEKNSSNLSEDESDGGSEKLRRLQSALVSSEKSCEASLTLLDEILKSLDTVELSYQDVTSKTNSLMSNCENLLEQQHSLNQTVEVLRKTLEPFNDIEEVANLLGIPFESSASPRNASSIQKNTTESVGNNLDPRSPEFQNILTRIASSFLFLRNHKEIRDNGKYTNWLEKLQNRATSLVARAVRDLLDKATKACVEMYQQRLYKQTNKQAVEDMPIESSPIYQKFRSLSFRVRELTILLKKSDSVVLPPKSSKTIDEDLDDLNIHVSVRGQEVVKELKLIYVQIRNELLLPFMKDSWISGINSMNTNGSSDNNKTNKTSNTVVKTNSNSNLLNSFSMQSLCSGIRLAYATLLRITQLEQQLFDSLFNTDSNYNNNINLASSNENGVNEYKNNNFHSIGESTEVLSIIEAISNATRDFLRPFIIHESSVDELCKVVSTLSEDVRSQMLAMPVPKLLLKQLVKGLDCSVNDAKERLTYCAENALRLEVFNFEPKHSHLAYPDILEESSKVSAVPDVEVDVYQTWYPPMRQTLSLLSKLYGVVEMSVFEDFARRAVDICVTVLRSGSESVKRSRAVLHGDLFLVRHLLILREQLVPFEIRLQGVEKKLDFSTTGQAISRMMVNDGSGNGVASLDFWYRLIRFDNTNILLEFARSGLPAMSEMQVDAKKDLDMVLKSACFSMKMSSLKMLLGPLDGFLNKVTAFVGDIPLRSKSEEQSMAHNNQIALLPVDARNNLKQQAFLRPERVKEMLESVQTMLIQSAPDLRAIMKLYIESPVARNILLKPILHEFEIYKKKMECVILSCLDPGQPRRDIEQLLQGVSYTVVSELSH